MNQRPVFPQDGVLEKEPKVLGIRVPPKLVRAGGLSLREAAAIQIMAAMSGTTARRAATRDAREAIERADELLRMLDAPKIDPE